MGELLSVIYITALSYLKVQKRRLIGWFLSNKLERKSSWRSLRYNCYGCLKCLKKNKTPLSGYSVPLGESILVPPEY